MGAVNERRPNPAHAWLYFAVAYAWSLAFWIPLLIFDLGLDSAAGALLYALGGAGPMAAGTGLAFLTQDRDGWRGYWRRVFDFRRIQGWWWAGILLIYPLLNALALVAHLAAGGSLPESVELERFASEPWAILPFALFILFFGPLPEELGWRGYALPRLLAGSGSLAASLLLGLFWALWHIPQFFVEGTYQQASVGFGTLGFWSFMVELILVSILYTWIFEHTRHSTLAAILFHFMINFSGELFSLPERAVIYRLLLVAVLAAAVSLARWLETAPRRTAGAARP